MKEGAEGDATGEARVGELLWGLCGSIPGEQGALPHAGPPLQGTLQKSPTELARTPLVLEKQTGNKPQGNAKPGVSRWKGEQRT